MADGGCSGGFHVDGLVHFDDADGAEDAYIGDVRSVDKRAEMGGEFLFDARHLCAPATCFDDANGCSGDGTGQRVSHEGWPMHHGAADSITYSIGGKYGGECHETPGERLSKAENVWGDSGGVGGKQRTCTPKSRGDFVGDEEYAVTVAESAYPGDKFRIVESHPTGTLNHGFDDDGRHG